MRRLRALITATVTLGLVTAATPVAAGTPPDRNTVLPLSRASAIVTDPVNGRVYVSSNIDSTVAVIEATGGVVGTVTGLPDARGLAVSGGTLYVALRNANAIAAVDTTTLTVRAYYPTGERTCPTHLATTGETVWFGYGCGTFFTGGLGSLRVGPDGPVVRLAEQGSLEMVEAPLVAALAGGSGPVAIGQPVEGHIHLFDIVAGAAKLRVSSDFGSIGENLRQLAFTLDGSRLVVASGYPYEVQAFTTTNLRLAGVYDTGPYPLAVAVSPDGRRVAAGISDERRPDVFVYQTGRATPRARYEVGATSSLVPRGLAWAPDSSRVYAVTTVTNPARAVLQVLPPPP